MNNYQNVFDCYPEVQSIYVVDGMPFLNASHAQSHAIATGKPVETVRRPAQGQDLPGDGRGPEGGEKPQSPSSDGLEPEGKKTAEKGKKPAPQLSPSNILS